ncbi:prefoldin subunit domain-containing protein [Hirsutella rhossiliensis]|uniref:Prefoldin subunit domain-containing protein n=1 Tax=Hirsutella rhossiliensis TaxID=111463 RepID=A0A9P8MUL4_9HYPO|nr:prefoldin subunit domain-containing protein [Hirsutella rhossiliensis]KAH0962413.1 prefoldin subunit domain-containing protein [Hirsutella rhossiliensis]
MAGVKDSFLDLERHRLQLEDNIKQLRKALQHWQTWDAEYEALKEEVDAAPESPDSEAPELHRIHSEYEGELLRGKELDDVFGPRGSRSREHIVNLLQRRIDYVTKNVESLQKQLEAVENRYAAATVISQPDATDEDSEPFTEIIENLDQDDNVVSYRLNRPGDSVPHVREALAKAGVEELPDADTSNATTPAPPPNMSRKAKRIERIMKTAREQESISQQEPVIPEDEEPEDAALRQQMLKYSMGEVGSVVAELQLEGGDTDDGEDFDYGHDDIDDESDQDDNDDDGEDRFGRSTSRLVTDEYRQRMLELEKRLGITSRFTQDADNEDADSDAEDEGIGRIVVKHGRETPSSASKPQPTKSSIKDGQGDVDAKKGVRFAQALDVAPDNEPTVPPMSEREEPPVEPLGDIVERSGPASASGPATEPRAPRRTSRFAKARHETASSGDIPKGPFDVPRRFADQGEPEPPASGPEGTTLADRLVEREPRPNPPPPGELDDSLDHDAVAGEYQALRKKFIQRQGGFLQEDESPIQVLDEAENASEPVSRFKAARLSRQ